MDVQALCLKFLHIMFLKLRFCKSGVFFFFWNSRYELLRSWFLSVFLNFRFTCALVCRCTGFVGYFVCIMDAKCFSYLLLAGVLFFRIFLVCRSYGHLSTRSHDYFVVKCTCAIVHLDAWPHRKPHVAPLLFCIAVHCFRPWWLFSLAHNKFPKVSCFGKNICYADHLFF